MKNALFVAKLDRLRQPDRDWQEFLNGKRSFSGNERLQIHPVDIIHHDRIEVSVLLYRVDGDRIGMIESLDNSGFSNESLNRHGILAQKRIEDFQRYDCPGLKVESAVYRRVLSP